MPGLIGNAQLIFELGFIKADDDRTIDVSLRHSREMGYIHYFLKCFRIPADIDFFVSYTVPVEKLLDFNTPASAGARIYFNNVSCDRCI